MIDFSFPSIYLFIYLFYRLIFILCAIRQGYVPRCLFHQWRYVYQVHRHITTLCPLFKSYPILFLFMLSWHSSYYRCLFVDHYHIVYGLYPIFFLLYCKLMFQNSRWVTHISLVADVQPQTETTWSVQTHNKQLAKIVTALFCCICSTDMFNHNINPNIFVNVFL